MTTIAFLGLGNMGGPMAANLLTAGHTVHGFDPVPAAAQTAAERGASVFGSGAEAVVGADVVITMLPNGELVKRCYQEVLPTASPGALFIDSSTISTSSATSSGNSASTRSTTPCATSHRWQSGLPITVRTVTGPF